MLLATFSPAAIVQQPFSNIDSGALTSELSTHTQGEREREKTKAQNIMHACVFYRNTFRVYYPFDYRFVALWKVRERDRLRARPCSLLPAECQTRDRLFTSALCLLSFSLCVCFFFIIINIHSAYSFRFVPLLLLMMRQCQIYFIPLRCCCLPAMLCVFLVSFSSLTLPARLACLFALGTISARSATIHNTPTWVALYAPKFNYRIGRLTVSHDNAILCCWVFFFLVILR